MVRLSGYTGLMDQIRFDQHHIPRFHQIGLTFYEIIPLSFCQIIKLIRLMKVSGHHGIFMVADHLIHLQPVYDMFI